jgi:hypothetical protein
MGHRPLPVPGSTKELGFLGSVLHVELPRDLDEQQLGNRPHMQAVTDEDYHVRFGHSSSSVFYIIIDDQLLACLPAITSLSLIQIFEASLSHLWSIWECLVLCEPIIIFGQSPTWTSDAIWWLRDVIRPVRRETCYILATQHPKPVITSYRSHGPGTSDHILRYMTTSTKPW